MRSISVNMSRGRPLGLLVRFALPLLIGNLFQQAYNLADSIIVGRFIGANALAAVGATGSVAFLFFSVCNGISSGGGIVTAQYFGAGDDAKVRRAIANSAYIMFSTSLFMGAVAFALTPAVLRWMGTPADILPDSITYMRMTCLSVPLIGVYNYTSSMLRALGDSRTPLYFLIVACLLNVALDLVFVLALGMGVFGAALATMIGQLLAGVGCLIFARRTNPYFMLSRRELGADWAIIRAFVSDEAVVALGGQALGLTSFFYIFLGTIFVTRGTLNGVGDTMFSLINGAIEVVCRITLPMVMVLIPGVGVWGIWWTAGLTWMISAAACLLRYFYWRSRQARLLAA